MTGITKWDFAALISMGVCLVLVTRALDAGNVILGGALLGVAAAILTINVTGKK